MQALRIVALCVLGAVLYGIAHDLVTAHVCLEYFTIGHPKILDDATPVRLALAWGVIATWWVGLPLGILLALAARVGSARKWDARRLVRPVAILLGIMAALALVAGLVASACANAGVLWLVEPLKTRVPPDRHVAFLAAGAAHVASYIVGGLGGLVLVLGVAIRRGREADGRRR